MSKEETREKQPGELTDEHDDWPSTSTTGAIIAAFLFVLGVIFVLLISKSPSGPSKTAAADTSKITGGDTAPEETSTACTEDDNGANTAAATEGECGGQPQSPTRRPPNYSGFKMTSGGFQKTDLTDAKFVKANLIGVSFKDAILNGADFTEVWLRGIDFTGANLEDAILTGALYDEATIFPEGFDPGAHGMKPFGEASDSDEASK